ncbi:MAG: hypothetical protein HQL59_09165 [Magnetococcales bacterium]|nr:hypothetical protein [Magnetococcales bacterium]
MKINIEIEVTAQEARKFMGLPDVEGLQKDVVDKLREKTLDRIESFDAALFDPNKMMTSWMSLYPEWMEGVKRMVGSSLANPK